MPGNKSLRCHCHVVEAPRKADTTARNKLLIACAIALLFTIGEAAVGLTHTLGIHSLTLLPSTRWIPSWQSSHYDRRCSHAVRLCQFPHQSSLSGWRHDHLQRECPLAGTEQVREREPSAVQSVTRVLYLAGVFLDVCRQSKCDVFYSKGIYYLVLL